MADWSSLPRDLLVIIAKLTLMASVKAFMAFRSTCSSWNVAAREDECAKLFRWPRIPFLLIPESGEYYSPSRNKSYFLKSPLLYGKYRMFMESGFGWLLALRSSDKVELIHPFSEERIQLPDCPNLLNPFSDEEDPFSEPFSDEEDPLNFKFFKRSILSANPSKASNYVLGVITSYGSLWFWRPGNKNWTLNDSSLQYDFYDLIFFSVDSMFYAIDECTVTWVWNVNRNTLNRVTGNLIYRGIMYLVESSAAELLVVEADIFTKFRGPRVYQLDIKNREWKSVTSLKDAIFVGNNASFSVLPDADDPIIKSNCIYFTFCNYRGIYSVKDGSTQQFPKTFDHSPHTSFPVWICPSSSSFMASLLCPPQRHFMKKVLNSLGYYSSYKKLK